MGMITVHFHVVERISTLWALGVHSRKELKWWGRSGRTADTCAGEEDLWPQAGGLGGNLKSRLCFTPTGSYMLVSPPCWFLKKYTLYLAMHLWCALSSWCKWSFASKLNRMRPLQMPQKKLCTLTIRILPLLTRISNMSLGNIYISDPGSAFCHWAVFVLATQDQHSTNGQFLY